MLQLINISTAGISSPLLAISLQRRILNSPDLKAFKTPSFFAYKTVIIIVIRIRHISCWRFRRNYNYNIGPIVQLPDSYN